MKLGELIIVGDDWYKIFRIIKDDRQWEVELLKKYWYCLGQKRGKIHLDYL